VFNLDGAETRQLHIVALSEFVVYDTAEGLKYFLWRRAGHVDICSFGGMMNTQYCSLPHFAPIFNVEFGFKARFQDSASKYGCKRMR
jgi:hypothetical protein